MMVVPDVIPLQLINAWVAVLAIISTPIAPALHVHQDVLHALQLLIVLHASMVTISTPPLQVHFV
jgi:hypothetical protein